jgi:hypothetical protein
MPPYNTQDIVFERDSLVENIRSQALEFGFYAMRKVISLAESSLSCISDVRPQELEGRGEGDRVGGLGGVEIPIKFSERGEGLGGGGGGGERGKGCPGCPGCHGSASGGAAFEAPQIRMPWPAPPSPGSWSRFGIRLCRSLP